MTSLKKFCVSLLTSSLLFCITPFSSPFVSAATGDLSVTLPGALADAPASPVGLTKESTNPSSVISKSGWVNVGEIKIENLRPNKKLTFMITSTQTSPYLLPNILKNASSDSGIAPSDKTSFSLNSDDNSTSVTYDLVVSETKEPQDASVDWKPEALPTTLKEIKWKGESGNAPTEAPFGAVSYSFDDSNKSDSTVESYTFTVTFDDNSTTTVGDPSHLPTYSGNLYVWVKPGIHSVETDADGNLVQNEIALGEYVDQLKYSVTVNSLKALNASNALQQGAVSNSTSSGTDIEGGHDVGNESGKTSGIDELLDSGDL